MTRPRPALGETLAARRAGDTLIVAEREYAGPASTETRLVFTRVDGKTVRPEFVTKHFHVLAKAASLPLIRLHELRHTGAVLAVVRSVASDTSWEAFDGLRNRCGCCAWGFGRGALEKVAAR